MLLIVLSEIFCGYKRETIASYQELIAFSGIQILIQPAYFLVDSKP